ncbi:uncharacterized protein METZ01_LOCUS82563 [marine metagenome]|uniref:Uncharacterized protein n=1 Tax=marine metagenome TaxID=408172 RepID=A0A381UNH5_9ZZZZ
MQLVISMKQYYVAHRSQDFLRQSVIKTAFSLMGV